MTPYEAWFTVQAAQEARRLPTPARNALDAELVKVIRNPLETTDPDPLKNVEAFRIKVFDDARHLAHLWIDDTKHRVWIISVV